VELEFITRQGGQVFTRQTLPLQQVLVLILGVITAQLRLGQGAAHSLEGHFSRPVIRGTPLGNWQCQGQEKSTLKKHSMPEAVQWGGVGNWAGPNGPVMNTKGNKPWLP